MASQVRLCLGLVSYNYNKIILGLYRDNGKENGNYYIGFRDLSSVFLVVDPSKIIFLISKSYTPKGGYNLTLYWVP